MTKAGAHYSGRRFRDGLAAFFAGRAVAALSTLLLLLAVVRWLDPGEYGAYMVVWGLCELAVPLTSLGVLPAVQQFLPRLVTRTDARTVRRFVVTMELARLGLILFWAAVIALGWGRVASWLGIPEAASSGLAVASLMVAVLGARFAAELLESLLEQRDAQAVRALQPIGRLLGLAVLWGLDQTGLAALLWMEVAVCALTLVVGQALLMRRLRSITTQGSEPLDWREVRQFIAHLSAAQLLTATGDAGAARVVVAKLLGPEAVGVFGFLQQLLMTANRYLPSLLLANVVRPMLVSREAEGNIAVVGVGVATLVKLNVVAALLVLSGVLAGGNDLLSFAMGRDVDNAGTMLALLLLGLLAQAVSQVIMLALQVYRLPSVVSRASMVSPATTLLCAVGAGAGGLTGAAAGMAAGMWMRGLVWLHAMRKAPATPIDWAGLSKCLAVSAAMGLAFAAARPWIGGLVAAIMCTFGLLGLVRWQLPLTADERGLLLRALGARARWLLRVKTP